MSLIYSGGLWSVFLVASVLAGYIWALNGPRWAYKGIILLAFLVIAGSWLLPEGQVFRVRVAQGVHWWLWAFLVAAPVLAYAMLVRFIKRKADAKYDSRRN